MVHADLRPWTVGGPDATVHSVDDAGMADPDTWALLGPVGRPVYLALLGPVQRDPIIGSYPAVSGVASLATAV